MRAQNKTYAQAAYRALTWASRAMAIGIIIVSRVAAWAVTIAATRKVGSTGARRTGCHTEGRESTRHMSKE